MNDELKRVLCLIASFVIIGLIITISLNLVFFLLPIILILIVIYYLYKKFIKKDKKNDNIQDAVVLEEKIDK